MDFVELDGVTKRFGNTTAVDNISLGIKKGEFLTLLGPSGCGKTTTLRLISGFLKPDEGSVYIRGEKMNGKPPYERNIGLVFQNYALFPHMTVYENVAFGLKMRKVKEINIKKRVKEALDIVRLSGFEERYPKQMSGGEQQRVALARAIVINPDALLLDEPLSNLDLKLRQQMRLELKQIQKRVGITSIYVTHDQGEALMMSDRIAVMNKGRIIQVGTSSTIYERPENMFVADFIGETNYFEGKILKINEREVTFLTKEGLTLFALLPQYGEEEIASNSKVSACVRPERIVVAKSRISGKNTFRGEIKNVLYSGSEVKYFIRIDKGFMLTVNKHVVNKSALHKDGDRVYVSWNPENSLLVSSK